MEIKLHANAKTTPAVRASIQASDEPVRVLAARYGVSEVTVRRWRARKSPYDRSHRPKNMRLSMSPQEAQLICALRRDLGLSIRDIAEVMNRSLSLSLSESAIGRCLKRHDVPKGPPREEEATGTSRARSGRFEETRFGYVHMDLKQLTKLKGKRAFVFVAIERTTRFVHVDIIDRKDRETVVGCVRRFLDSFPGQVHTILTDNGSEFTDRFSNDMKGKPKDQPSGKHPLDILCRKRKIKHRLTRPYRPQTNGMVERFNRRLAEAIREDNPTRKRKNRFPSHTARRRYIQNFADAYNRTRLKCIGFQTPTQKLNNQTGLNTKGEVEIVAHDFG